MIIIDGENSFLNFPKIDQMIPETQKYMKENGYGDIKHQVLTISKQSGLGNATLSFSELDGMQRIGPSNKMPDSLSSKNAPPYLPYNWWANAK